MLVVLPDGVDGLGDIEKTLTAEKLAEWESRLAPAVVHVTFPRFKTDLSLDLCESLRVMGVHQAFSAKADFSGMAREALMISRVLHQARIDVTEEGTEAAAATAVVMQATAIRSERPKVEIFNADHPYLYVIRRNDSKAILFIGRLLEP